MKAIISTTYDDKYLYFLPITTWLWSKLGVDTICFMPYLNTSDENKRVDLINDTFRKIGIKPQYAGFASPKHKEATYAQCSRLYGACLDLPEDEVLITGDVDMAMFKLPEMVDKGFSVFGSDLVPFFQYPICYISAKVSEWRKVFNLQYGALSANDGAVPTIETKTYQKCLDELLGNIECESFRGNYWGKDQEEAYNKIANTKGIVHYIPRSNGQNQFAQNRVDRDDLYWRDRLNLDVIDAHLWRDGYIEQNHNNIMELLTYMYPNENFDWLATYRNEYIKLL